MPTSYKIDHKNKTIVKYSHWDIGDGSAEAEAHMKTAEASDHIEYRVLRKWEVEEFKIKFKEQ